MIIDVGASELACRGDICLIYSKDTAKERDLKDYDALWPKRDGKKVYYASLKELVEKIRENVRTGDVVIAVHSIEHTDCPFDVLRAIAEAGAGELHVYVPNAVVNDADWKDETHVYSFTAPALGHLLRRAMPGYEVHVEPVFGGRDLHGYAKRE